MITITINDKDIQLDKPVTILEAAKSSGIHIPHFCHHPVLEQWGGCRMCLVEVEKMPRLQTACTLYVTDGMKIKTESDTITAARKSALEFLLINHPLECPVCDKGGECKLQDYVMKYGPTQGRFREAKLKHPESLEDSLMVRNTERCIKCTRCVRMCGGVQGASAIAMSGRGNHTLMEPFSGGVYECEYCGNCLTVCPVGAIMSKLHRYQYRPWQLTGEVKTVCSYCGVGCSLFVQIRDNSIMRVVPKIGTGVNNGLLCNRGRFGYEYVGSEERLTTPLLKINGKLEPVSWREAIATVVSRLKDIRTSSGGKTIAGIAGARCTNEENYAFQKLIRGLGSNNVDSITRMGLAGALRSVEWLMGAGATANTMGAIASSDAVLVWGGDPTQINPVLGLQVREAFRKGAKVVTSGYTPGLVRYRSLHFSEGRTDGLLATITGLLLKDKTLSAPKIAEKIKALALPSPEEYSSLSGAKKDDVLSAAAFLSGASSPAIIVGRDAMQRASDILLICAIADLSKAKIYLMSERPNEFGLIDMGCLPDALPGGVGLDSAEMKKKLASAWKFDVPSEKGLTLMDMVSGAMGGGIKAMYVMGENPAFNLPDSASVIEALGKLDFLIVQDIFMTETARLADVVLPSLSWSEKDGTYTNLERRIQRLRKAVSKENCKEDWRIIKEVGEGLGIYMPYAASADIRSEIKNISPLHAGMSEKDIEGGNAVWPYGGKAQEPLEQDIKAAVSPGRSSGKPVFMLEKPLFHSGTLSRKSPALRSIYPEPLARVGSEAAKSFGIKDGDTVTVSTGKSSMSLKVKVDESIEGPYVFLTNNFEGKGAFALVGYSLEPLTGAPAVADTELSLKKE